MITESQKEIRQQLISLKSELEKSVGKNPLYSFVLSKLDGLIKDMETKEFSAEKLDMAKNLFETLRLTVGEK